jgi:hypothetical protein
MERRRPAALEVGGCTCWSPGSGRSPACCSVRHSGCSACLWPGPVSAGLVVGAVRWQALMNLILAIFNLLPGAPLDCGGMLQAILWRRHGHRTRPR